MDDEDHSEPNEEFGWVIEGAWSSPSAPQYWVGGPAWSGDHYQALRFARRRDAKQAAEMMLDGIKIRICEHQWTVADGP